MHVLGSPSVHKGHGESNTVQEVLTSAAHHHAHLPRSLFVFLNSLLGHGPHSWYLQTPGSSQVRAWVFRSVKGTLRSFPMSSSSIARIASMVASKPPQGHSANWRQGNTLTACCCDWENASINNDKYDSVRTKLNKFC